jgi:hypothetical protein
MSLPECHSARTIGRLERDMAEVFVKDFVGVSWGWSIAGVDDEEGKEEGKVKRLSYTLFGLTDFARLECLVTSYPTHHRSL